MLTTTTPQFIPLSFSRAPAWNVVMAFHGPLSHLLNPFSHGSTNNRRSFVCSSKNIPRALLLGFDFRPRSLPNHTLNLLCWEDVDEYGMGWVAFWKLSRIERGPKIQIRNDAADGWPKSHSSNRPSRGPRPRDPFEEFSADVQLFKLEFQARLITAKRFFIGKVGPTMMLFLLLSDG